MSDWKPAPEFAVRRVPDAPDGDSGLDEIEQGLLNVSITTDASPTEQKEERLSDDLVAIRAKIDRILKNYKFTKDSTEIRFAPSKNSRERALVHNCAKAHNLASVSYGSGRERYVTILDPSFSQPRTAKTDSEPIFDRFVVRENHVFLEGPSVEAAALRDRDAVTDEMRKQRSSRDGPYHHITLAHSSMINQLCAPEKPFAGLSASEAAERLAQRFAKQVANDWKDAGLGQLTDQKTGAQAMFRVLKWPAAQQLCAELGLPPLDPHITLGFLKHDIHDQRKDENTLIRPRRNQPMPTVATPPPPAAAAAAAAAAASTSTIATSSSSSSSSSATTTTTTSTEDDK